MHRCTQLLSTVESFSTCNQITPVINLFPLKSVSPIRQKGENLWFLYYGKKENVTMVVMDIEKHPSPSSMSTSVTSGLKSSSPLKSLLKRYDGNSDGRIPILNTADRPPQSVERRRRRVRFHKTIYNRRIPHLNDMSERLRESIWIQPEEYHEIRQRCITTVKKMMMGDLTVEDIESEEHCPRGLEGKTREGAAKRKEFKLDSLAAVLEEQSLQWNEDVEDDEAIMECYSVFSIPCAQAAHETAVEDEQVIQEYIQEEEHFYDCNYNRGNFGGCQGKNDTNSSATLPSLALSGLVEKLTNVVSTKSRRAALLREIEQNFYDESSIQRSRKREEEQYSYRSMPNSVLAKQIRMYFLERRNMDQQRDPSKVQQDRILSYDGSDESAPSLLWDEESSSCLSDSSNGTFTSELSDMFHSRRRRKSLLDEIERSYYVEPTIVATKPSNVTTLGQKLSSSLNPIFWVRMTRQSLLQELSLANTSRNDPRC